MTEVENRYTRGIANFIANLRYEDLPAEVRHRAKLLILDAFGSGLYAADLTWSQLLRDMLLQVDSTRDCSV